VKGKGFLKLNESNNSSIMVVQPPCNSLEHFVRFHLIPHSNSGTHVTATKLQFPRKFSTCLLHHTERRKGVGGYPSDQLTGPNEAVQQFTCNMNYGINTSVHNSRSYHQDRPISIAICNQAHRRAFTLPYYLMSRRMWKIRADPR
jgi:hypothetical protein